MTNNVKITHIWKMVLAPITYTGISVLVNFMFIFLCALVTIIKDPTLTEAQLMDSTEKLCLSNSVLITLIAALITIPIMYFVFFDRRGERVKASIAYIFVGLFGFGCCIFLNFLIAVVDLPSYSPTYQELTNLIYTGNVFLEIIAVGIVAPIVEELIYRGVVFKRINAMIKTIPAILLSSVIFGAIHGNLVQFVYATCLGVALCFVYIKCKSIMAPILLHVTANMVSIFASDVRPVYKMLNKPVVFVLVLVLAIIMTIICPIFIIMFSKRTDTIDVCKSQISSNSDIQQ